MGHPAPDPVIVDQLVHDIGTVITTAATTDEASSADLLSALFIVLERVLTITKKHQKPEDKEFNRKEINRVLTDLNDAFGATVN